MGVYDALKDAVSIAQKADNIDLYRSLIDAQKECLELIEENISLKEHVKMLQNISDIDKNLVFENNCYNLEGNLYCSVCWDSTRKLIRLHSLAYAGYPGEYTCEVCNTSVYNSK